MVKLDLEIDPKWFNAEIRNDHYVCRCTKELWAIQLDMLYKVQQICDKHNIKWWIDAGTLLGAVRHRGFIPWDDDVDIVMFRDDYDKFLEVARIELKDPYFLQTDWTDKVFYCHTKIRRTDTTGILTKDTLANFDFNQGIFIDIFPLDTVPSDDENAYRNYVEHLWMMKNELLLARSRWWMYERDNEMLYDKCLHLRDAFDIVRKYYRDSDFTDVANLSLPSIRNEIRKNKSEFDETVYVDFEMLKVPAPGGWHTILTRLYGDYMTPVQGGSKHGTLLYDTNESYKTSPLVNGSQMKNNF